MQTASHGDALVWSVLPRSKHITALLIVSFTGLTVIAAQFEVQLPFTPVPITGQTFAVLLCGAALGSRAGATSQILYVGLGVIGLPVYAGGDAGVAVLLGATGGYLIGFILAAYLVGKLAEHQHDRRVRSAIPTFLAGNLVIYLVGVPWLAVTIQVSLREAIALGLFPFVIGDAIKLVIAGTSLPLIWRLLENRSP